MAALLSIVCRLSRIYQITTLMTSLSSTTSQQQQYKPDPKQRWSFSSQFQTSTLLSRGVGSSSIAPPTLPRANMKRVVRLTKASSGRRMPSSPDGGISAAPTRSRSPSMTGRSVRGSSSRCSPSLSPVPVSQFALPGGRYSQTYYNCTRRKGISERQRSPVSTYIGVTVVRARVRALGRG